MFQPVSLNFSGSGVGSGSGEPPVPAELHFPCRAPQYSRNSTTPLVWGSLPQLEHAQWYVVAIESVFLIVGLAWNWIILSFYFREPQLLKEPANIFLFNLTISDILFSVFITLSTLTAEAAGEFVFGSSDNSRCIYCQFLGAMMCTLICTSLYTIAALSVNRCIMLTRPLQYKSIFTWKSAVVIQIFIWVISVAVSIPPLFGFGDYEYNLAFAFCNARWTGDKNGVPNVYFILLFGLQSIVPITILIFTNIWVVKIAKTVMKKKIKRRRSFKDANTDIQCDEQKYQRQQAQLVRVFGALLVAHAVCWVPVFTIFFVSVGLGADKVPSEMFVVSWLAFLTSPVIHPILETCFVKDLRYKVNRTGRTMRSSLRKAQRTLSSQQLSFSSLPKGLSLKRIPTMLFDAGETAPANTSNNEQIKNVQDDVQKSSQEIPSSKQQTACSPTNTADRVKRKTTVTFKGGTGLDMNGTPLHKARDASRDNGLKKSFIMHDKKNSQASHSFSTL